MKMTAILWNFLEDREFEILVGSMDVSMDSIQEVNFDVGEPCDCSACRYRVQMFERFGLHGLGGRG